MLKNYLKIGLRNLLKHKSNFLINISGLTIGFTCCLLIFHYVVDELNFDRFHEKSEQIFRIIEKRQVGGSATEYGTSLSGLAAEALVDYFPEVENAAKVYQWYEKKLLRSEDKKFYLDRFVYTNESFFEVFDFKLLQGDPAKVLNKPFSIVLTQEIAVKFFGAKNPIGKILQDDRNAEFKITGVMENPPQNSHLQFEALVSWSSAQNIGWMNSWRAGVAKTYVLLSADAPAVAIEKKFPDFVQAYMPHNVETKYSLQPLRDIHFRSAHIKDGLNWQKSHIQYIYISSAIAFCILLIACFNFINFSTARSMTRAKEVGMRKVVGAQRSQLIKQFLAESALLSLMAVTLALFLAELLHPTIQSLFGRKLETPLFENPLTIVAVLFLALAVGMISGCYPAFFLSAFRPINVLKEAASLPKGRNWFRNGFIFLQFSISTALIIATLLIYKQLNFLSQKDLGFQKEQVVVSRLISRELLPKYEAFKNELLSQSDVQSVAISSHIMGEGNTTFTIYPEGVSETETWSIPGYCVDPDFIPTLGLNLIKGRNFSPEMPTDATNAVIINQTLAQKLGWTSPLGKSIRFNFGASRDSQVIGVVEDFHFKSLHEEIGPIMLFMSQNWLSFNVSVRIAGENIPQSLNNLGKIWADYFPNHPFAYSFLDEKFGMLYEKDERFSDIIGYFALLGIIISCLGLFGLAAFTTEQRTKEVGVRKVLGASVPHIFSLLCRDITKPVLFANIVAWPIAYFVMTGWLQEFAYKISVDLSTFFLAGTMSMLIAIATVSYQTLKSALDNPVKALRNE